MIRRLALTASLLVAGTPALFASSLKCVYTQDCYNCIGGAKYDDCSLDCNACGGTRCLPRGASLEAPEPAGPEPLHPLIPFSTERLGTAIHPGVERVFTWFWRWYTMPVRVQRDTIEAGGSVLIDGKPHDFTLDVEQRGAAQVYLVDIEAFGKVTLTVNEPKDGRQELEFDFQPIGDARARGGQIMLKQ